jgi:hypothetical protein
MNDAIFDFRFANCDFVGALGGSARGGHDGGPFAGFLQVRVNPMLGQQSVGDDPFQRLGWVAGHRHETPGPWNRVTKPHPPIANLKSQIKFHQDLDRPFLESSKLTRATCPASTKFQ